ncbi:Mu transposase domain-containing protein [Streptomyces viridosporus]|uniref:Mu transposase domain-containing protein n=1 Tax=Streptomyces viridosporus TaxID=67581 RepID=UPI00030B7D88|nr:hypothetical protein [Streptomyces viridosporus]
MPLPEEPFETVRLFTPRVDRYDQIPVRTNRYSVPIRRIGKRVRAVLHASHLVVYDQNVEVARHERLIAKGSVRPFVYRIAPVVINVIDRGMPAVSSVIKPP